MEHWNYSREVDVLLRNSRNLLFFKKYAVTGQNVELLCIHRFSKSMKNDKFHK